MSATKKRLEKQAGKLSVGGKTKNRRGGLIRRTHYQKNHEKSRHFEKTGDKRGGEQSYLG